MLDHLFLEVWCKAEPNVEFDVPMLHADLQDIMNEIYYDAEVPVGTYFYEPIEKVYKIFQSIDMAAKAAIALSYKNNNLIQDLCVNEQRCIPVTYQQLEVYHPDLPETLKNFYKNLYENTLDLEAVSGRIGAIRDHYDEFVKNNDEGKCPYCGINSLKGVYNTKREAYDHYLPKSKYPFNSVNFYNLAPMCHECNSSYKAAKDPLTARPKVDPITNNSGRRKAFYSYDDALSSFEIKVGLSSLDISHLKPDDITLTFVSTDAQEEIDTWLDVFGIEERYKDHILNKSDGKYWLVQAIDEYENYPEEVQAVYTREQHINKMIIDAQATPFAHGNFLKEAFLKEYLRIANE